MSKQFTYSIMGIQYRVIKPTRRMMHEAAPFMARIEREPDNFHDHNALKVIIAEKGQPWTGMHIGYLPRQVSEEWAPAIDAGALEIVEAWITDVTEDATGEVLVTTKRKPNSKKVQLKA